MNLHKSTHIPLLKNDAQLKKKKIQSPKFIIKTKIMP